MKKKNNQTKTSTQETKTPAMVYVGPNLSGDLLILSYAVFWGGYPVQVKERIEKDAAFAALFVPVNELAGIRRQMADPTHRLSRLATKIRKGEMSNVSV